MKKGLNGRKVDTKKEASASAGPAHEEGDGFDRERRREYFQVRSMHQIFLVSENIFCLSKFIYLSKIYLFSIYQVEISANRHSGGSDKYSVVDKNDEEEEGDTSYAIIDMTDPVPR